MVGLEVRLSIDSDLGWWTTSLLKRNVANESEVACSSGQEEKIMSLVKGSKSEADHPAEARGMRCNL